MEFAFKGTQTAAAWEHWHRTNMGVRDGGVEIAVDSAPGYLDPTPIAIEPPPGFAAAGTDVDACGNLYVVTPASAVYRYDPRQETLDRVPCTFEESTGTPAGVCVTEQTIYLVRDGVQAVSRYLLQPRWFVSAPFVDPVGIAPDGEGALVLDAGIAPGEDSSDGTGFLARVSPDGSVEQLVTGVVEPVDLGVDRTGGVYILAREGDEDVVRVFDSDGVESEDPLRIPEGIQPACIAIEGTGSVLLGVGRETVGEPSLFRYHRDTGAVERLSVFDRACSSLQVQRLRSTGAPSGLYAVDAESWQIYRLDGAVRRTRNEETGRYDAQLVRRFDSASEGMQWHRVTLEHELGGVGTQVRLRYYATDNANVRYADVTGEIIPVRAVRGIGPTFAGRLHNAGITGLTGLVRRTPAVIASIVSTEVIEVSPDRTANWLETAHGIIDTHQDTEEALDLQLVNGIGPTYASRLQDVGVVDLRELVDYSAAEISAVVSQSIHNISPRRVEGWLEQARSLLEERGIGEIDLQEVASANPQDALLMDAIGRYLWVEIDLVGAEYASPQIRSFRAYYPRQSFLRHLPAIYQDDELSAAFLERFLAIFESVFVDIEEEIEGFTRYLDPHGIPPEYVSWLGRWLALDPGETWPTPAKRELVRRAPELFRKRGTRAGLQAILEIYVEHVDVPPPPWHGAGRPARKGNAPVDQERRDRPGRDPESRGDTGVITHADEPLVYVWEHADLDCIDSASVREAYEALIPCPQCFLVLVRSYLRDEMVGTVEEVVAAEQPAHAVGRVVQLKPWMQLGGNSYLGINSVLPARDFVLAESSLGQDTVLREREPHGQFGLRSRLGTDTVIS